MIAVFKIMRFSAGTTHIKPRNDKEKCFLTAPRRYFIMSFWLFYVAACLSAVASIRAQGCSEDEEYQKCGTACPKTCDNYSVKINCLDKCVSGCFCKTGLLRAPDYSCVPLSECGCSRDDQQFYDCMPYCKNRCDYKPGTPCPDICYPGCFCRDDLLLDSNNHCVPEEQCDYASSPHNETFVDCVSPCTDCLFVKSECPIRFTCHKGYDCKPGYVRNETKDCILEKDCNLTD